ncbi:MAG: guanylate kinase [Cyanobacteriota bacterium]|nr:guanylate kinase [Cyanobacteriota bacterium]
MAVRSPYPAAATPPSSLPPTGQLILLTGPSGVGKGTLLQGLCQRHPNFRVSVSATTRAPRPGEVEGKDYYFVSREQFQNLIDQGALLEWAEFAGNYYGTPKAPVMEKLAAGQGVILEIELEGARQVRQTFPDALQVFVLPPSLTELEHRIRQRGQDSEAAIARRLHRAQVEIEAAPEFDVQIVNDQLESALQQLEQVILQTATSDHSG